MTLDKYVDAYGSPSLEEISSFTETLSERMCESLGNAVVESLKFEVSSPGAERRVRLPFELSRFDHLPMKVCHRMEDDKVSRKADFAKEICIPILRLSVSPDAVFSTSLL